MSDKFLGERVVTRTVEVKIGRELVSLEKGSILKVTTYDEDLDRILIEYPDGRIDWKRSFFLDDFSIPRS